MKQGSCVTVQIGSETFAVGEGDTYFHPMGIIHQHKVLKILSVSKQKYFLMVVLLLRGMNLLE